MDARAPTNTAPGTRALGEQERLLHYAHRLGGMITAIVLHVQGPLDDARVRRALDLLQRRHPLLNVHIRMKGFGFTRQLPLIYRKPYFVTAGTTPIPLRVIENAPGGWRAELQRELRRKIGSGRHPRMRVTMVRDGADTVHLIFSTDHVVSDAQAGFTGARDFMAFLADPDGQPPRNDHELPPALESRFTRSSDPGHAYEPAIRLPTPRIFGREMTEMTRRALDKDVADRLRAAVAAHRTTIHGAVSAALLQAAGKHFCKTRLTFLTPAELRKLCKPPLPADTYGCYIDLMRSTHDLGQPFWRLAAEVPMKLIRTLARHEKQSSMLRLPDWPMYRHETLGMMSSNLCLDGIAVATGGETGLAARYGDYVLDDITMAVSLYPFGISIYVLVLEWQGMIRLNFCYGRTRMRGADIEAIADMTAATLADPPKD